jgi:protein-S-isoprenylcysteine O-methyltransferase Ste14
MPLLDINFSEILYKYSSWIFSNNQASRLLLLSILWFVLELVTRIIARYNGAPTKTAKTKDRGSWLLVALSSIFLFGIISHYLKGVSPDLPNYLFPVGIILMLLGYALRIWAVITLGQFFTMKVMIFSNHQLIDKGPYRWLQHPSYSGVFLTALGFGLASGYLLILITFLIVLSYVLGYRIYVEEKALREQFGDDWTSYQAKRWRILPWIL